MSVHRPAFSDIMLIDNAFRANYDLETLLEDVNVNPTAENLAASMITRCLTMYHVRPHHKSSFVKKVQKMSDAEFFSVVQRRLFRNYTMCMQQALKGSFEGGDSDLGKKLMNILSIRKLKNEMLLRILNRAIVMEVDYCENDSKYVVRDTLSHLDQDTIDKICKVFNRHRLVSDFTLS